MKLEPRFSGLIDLGVVNLDLECVQPEGEAGEKQETEGKQGGETASHPPTI
jgi:hypothetical protein